MFYRINSPTNTIEPLQACSFAELGFRERAHLQEWIAKQPGALGEELLIIQKEFSGFSDTQERLDLLALDKEGSIVVIENKLDDTGRDVTWQALKYASYCASLQKEDIRSVFQEYLDSVQNGTRAEDFLSAFYDVEDTEELILNKGVTQRIILVAANFRKEVTSTVLWLTNFKVRIQCFKASPFRMGESLFLNIEQIIPTQDAEEFMISLAEKAREEVENVEAGQRRHRIRREFWTKVLKALSGKSELFGNISPGKEIWISAATGVRGISWILVGNKNAARVELYIDRGEKVENRRIFDLLYSQRHEIETDFGGKLIWEPLENRRACRIKAETEGNIYDPDSWEPMIAFITDTVIRLERATRERLLTFGRTRTVV